MKSNRLLIVNIARFISYLFKMETIQEKQRNLELSLMYRDIALKDAGFFWRSRKKEQGFNLAIIENPLSEDERENLGKVLPELVSDLDRMNCALLEASGAEVPRIRLNRLDVGIDKSGGIFLIEQNPGWVDLLGFSGVLSEDPTVLFYLSKLVSEEYGAERFIFLYADYTKFAKYEMEATAEIIARRTSLATEVMPVAELRDTEEKTAYYLNAPYESLTEEERRKLESAAQAGMILPSRSITMLEDKTFLLGMERFRPRATRFPDTFSEFIGLVRSGMNMLKPTRSFSTRGVVPRIDDLYEGGLLQVFNEVKGSGREYILEEEIDLKTVKGVGYDYVGTDKERPELYTNSQGKKVYSPVSVKINDWPAKYCVWTINDIVGPVVGVASKGPNEIVINDAGFFFRV